MTTAANKLFTVYAGGVSLDPDAAAYARERNLDAATTARLSGFVSDIKTSGFDPAWLSLGGSEWKALDGSTHHAVIGGDATLTNSFTETTTGLVFAGSSEVFEFANPAQSASQPSLALYAVMATDAATTDEAAISGYYGSTKGTDFGPSLNLGQSRASSLPTQNKIGVEGVSVNDVTNIGNATGQALFAGSHRLHGCFWSVNGIRPLSRDDVANTRPLALTSGALMQAGDAQPLENLWSNTANLRVGRRGDGFDPFDGEYALGLIATSDVTSEMHMALLEALRKYQIADIPNPTLMAFVGDSMTDLGDGSLAREDSRSDQIISQSSDWQEAYYFNVAQSGQDISVQEGFHTTALNRLKLAPSWDRWITYWGGYNPPGGFDITDQTDRETLIDRYIAMAEEDAQNGISSIHWSVLIGGLLDPVTDAAEFAGYDAWNSYYKTQVESLQDSYPAVRVLWYDHRETYASEEFDGTGRTASYFDDGRHLSESGNATLVADFLARFPSPQLDTDAAATIAQLEAQGETLTGSQKEAINKWFVDEKAAGTYTNIKHLYLPVFGSEDVNNINWITAAQVGGFGGTITHADGYVTTTDGSFDMGQTPTQMGMTTTSMWLAGLLLDGGLGTTKTLLGSRSGGNNQAKVATNSSGDLVVQNGATSLTDTGYAAEAGIISGSHVSGELFLALRNASGRSKLATSAGAASGGLSTENIHALALNVSGSPSNQHGQQAAMYAAGEGLTDSEDEATTLRLATLYTALTGNALP